MRTWVPWSPRWAPHVKGEYAKGASKDPDGKSYKYMRAVCIHMGADGKRCNQSWQGRSSCGNVKALISRFARAHFHRDFNDGVPRVVASGSLRVTNGS